MMKIQIKKNIAYLFFLFTGIVIFRKLFENKLPGYKNPPHPPLKRSTDNG
jgi:hypothetical protein